MACLMNATAQDVGFDSLRVCFLNQKKKKSIISTHHLLVCDLVSPDLIREGMVNRGDWL